MTNTMAALDQFAQALGPMLSQPSPLGTSLPGDPGPVPPAAPPAAVKAAGPEKSQPVATRRDGITRKGTRGDWPRRVGLAVLALTIGLGLTRIVRATERAGESYQRQETVKSLAGRCAPRAHPSPHRTAPRSSE